MISDEHLITYKEIRDKFMTFKDRFGHSINDTFGKFG